MSEVLPPLPLIDPTSLLKTYNDLQAELTALKQAVEKTEGDGTHKTGIVTFPDVEPAPVGEQIGTFPGITITNH